MEKNNATVFVEKMFTDDKFLEEVCRHGGFKKDANDEEKTALILKASGEMGYHFSAADYEEAMTSYFSGKGVFASIKAFAHMNKIIRVTQRKMR